MYTRVEQLCTPKKSIRFAQDENRANEAGFSRANKGEIHVIFKEISYRRAKTNFRIVPQPEINGAAIENTHPAAGELQTCRSHWGEPAHDTFALILLEPNLSGTGYVLLIEGLDIAGTQAAAELLFSSGGIEPIVKHALRKDGSLHPFEVFVRATSIQSNAEGTQIIASRIH